MKTKIMMLAVALCLFVGNASAQWAVIDPTNLAHCQYYQRNCTDFKDCQ